MHIASAFKKKIVSVWGNTIPEFGMYPYLPDPTSEIMEIKGLKCRPCTKIGFTKCPKKHFKCILDLDDDYIAQRIRELYY
jgi:ADP-heptose:LPS heptosyltransferase